jgi:hypothetical protein
MRVNHRSIMLYQKDFFSECYLLSFNKTQHNCIVRGSIFTEPVQQVILVTTIGSSLELIVKGLTSGKVYEPVLPEIQLAQTSITPDQFRRSLIE